VQYRIESIDFFVRETKPARFPSALGKQGRGATAQRVTSPLCHVRMMLRDASGKVSFGCAADRLSVRWLDKRPGRSKTLKLRELTSLIRQAREFYLAKPGFDSPFAQWLARHKEVVAAGRAARQEDLTSTFASALLERALLDGVSRLAEKPLFEMVRDDRLGIEAEQVHPELKGVNWSEVLPARPLREIFVRHTVGLYDPLSEEDWPASRRLNDGLPETLADCISFYGLRHFKLKISGDAQKDLRRLARIWDLLPHQRQPVITLDANEAFDDLEQFAQFVKRLEKEQLGLFQHVLFIEQPLPRRLSHAPRAERWIRQISRAKPVIIDESDGALTACRQALALGYAGTSHKNCKGVFKSLMNRALLLRRAEAGKETVHSAEDLQNLPVAPLQQDLAVVGMLGITHCERNGHHYNFGLSMLSEQDKASVARRHTDLYEQRGGEWFLKIRNGVMQCGSLQCPGLGVFDEPDWASMPSMAQWSKQRGILPG